MDKYIFKAQSFKEASEHQKHYDVMDKSEQAKVFFIMMQAAYGFVGHEFPKMEKIYIGSRKLSDE